VAGIIVAVIAGVSIPMYLKYRADASKKSVVSDTSVAAGVLKTAVPNIKGTGTTGSRLLVNSVALDNRNGDSESVSWSNASFTVTDGNMLTIRVYSDSSYTIDGVSKYIHGESYSWSSTDGKGAWGVTKSDGKGAITDVNVFTENVPMVDANSQAVTRMNASTGVDEQVNKLIAGKPQAYWLTPSNYPVDKVAAYVSSVINDSRGAIPVFVVYGIPYRDCSQSAGITDADYLAWIDAVTKGLGAGRSALVYEPDAVAFMPSCPQIANEKGTMRTALSRISHAHTAIYLDAGHYGWQSVESMAGLVNELNADHVLRGFSVNVSNFDVDSVSRAYGEAISGLTGNLHYVIDSSRNGAVTAPGDACNATGARIGHDPGVSDYGHQDAWLWVKRPGESDADGTGCHGGPVSGQWWQEYANKLVNGS
jgi:endoglucanase